MEKNSDSTHPDFWTLRYATGRTPWDFGGAPAALKSFLAKIFRFGAEATDPGSWLWDTRFRHSIRPGVTLPLLIFRLPPSDQAKKGDGFL